MEDLKRMIKWAVMIIMEVWIKVIWELLKENIKLQKKIFLLLDSTKP